MRTSSERYDAIVRIATEMGVHPPTPGQALGWSTPAFRSPLFETAVDVHLLANRRESQSVRKSRSTTVGNARVYFVRGGGMVKIGITCRLERRMLDLRMASPIPLELLLSIRGDLNVEQHLHRRFRPLRAHGEWFRAEEPLLYFVEKLSRRYFQQNPERGGLPGGRISR